MYALLTQTDWDNIKDILNMIGSGIFLLALMFFLYKIFFGD